VGVGAAVIWASRRLPSRLSTHWARGLILTTTAVAAALVADSGDFPDWVSIPVVAAGLLILWASTLWQATMGTRVFLTVAATMVVALGALSGVTFVDGWARWNYEGYEAKGPWPEYQALMVELDGLPDGRVHWEANSDLNKYGTPMSPMLIPYWTEGSHQSMEGLFFESSLTTPFHFINSSEMSLHPSNPIPGLPYKTFDMERGIKHLQVYGVSYYVSFTPEATEKADGMDELTKVVTTEPFTIYQLPDTQLVEPARYLPAVYEVPERSLLGSLIGESTVLGSDGESLPSFHDMALEWYVDIENLDRLVVAGGPEDWPRIESLDQRPNRSLTVPENAVSNIVVDHHRIEFTTEAVGVPHVVKVSYFPNWTATGAQGPWRATPSLMVVVPTSEHVILSFDNTWAELTGAGLTVAGLVALAVAGLLVRRRARES
jgi:hypothetical protein